MRYPTDVPPPYAGRLVHTGGAKPPMSFDWPKSKDEKRNVFLGLAKAKALGFTFNVSHRVDPPTHLDDAYAEKRRKIRAEVEPGALPQLDD